MGPNGAGKSTTIDILATLITKDKGEVLINDYLLGRDDSKIRASIGVVFQNSVLDDLLTVKENLQVRGSFYGLKGEVLKSRMAVSRRNSLGGTGFESVKKQIEEAKKEIVSLVVLSTEKLLESNDNEKFEKVVLDKIKKIQ